MKAKRIPRKRRKRTPEDIRFDRCVGEIIREAREAKSISLQTAAEVGKMSSKRLERIEAGAAESYVLDLFRLSRCLGVSHGKLMTRAYKRMKEDDSRG